PSPGSSHPPRGPPRSDARPFQVPSSRFQVRARLRNLELGTWNYAPMNLLITAGNTQSPIDRVRCITNIFSGRTGAQVARTAWGRGHTVTLATSRPDALLEFGVSPHNPGERFRVLPYRTFDELTTLMQSEVRAGGYDVLCHSAAVRDYLPAGALAP